MNTTYKKDAACLGLLIVSNRLPVTVKIEVTPRPTRNSEVQVIASSGGLGHRPSSGHHEKSDGMWIGWPGETDELNEGQKAELEDGAGRSCAAFLFICPKETSRVTTTASPTGSSGRSSIISSIASLTIRATGTSYRRGQRTFCRCCRQSCAAATISYGCRTTNFVSCRRLLRERHSRGKDRILSSTSRFLPTRCFARSPGAAEILRGLMGADLIGFHTFGYLRHFTSSLLRLLGLETEVDRIQCSRRREVKVRRVSDGDRCCGVSRSWRTTQRSKRRSSRSRPVRAPRSLASIRRIRSRRCACCSASIAWTTPKVLPRRLLGVRASVAAECAKFTGESAPRSGGGAVPYKCERVRDRTGARSTSWSVESTAKFGIGGVDPSAVSFIRSIAQTDLVALYRAAHVMLVTRRCATG